MNLLGVKVTCEEFNKLLCEQAKGKELKVVNGCVVAREKKLTQKELNMQMIADLKTLLANSDYKAIKFAEGLISNEDYAQIKAQRQFWREEIGRLEIENNQ